MANNGNHHTAHKTTKPTKPPTETNPYLTPLGLSNTQANATVVCDAAITVWMEMGLSEDQIIYGLAFLNVESGYLPQKTNGVDVDTIRGLGQFNVATWNSNVKAFDKAYGIAPGGVGFVSSSPAITNANFTVAKSSGTNAQAGEAVDPTAGAYDPQGLVTQLKALGMIIQSEWSPSSAEQQDKQIDAMISAGVHDATLLKNPTGQTPLQDHAARAYLNHHEGSAWWDLGVNAKGHWAGMTHREATVDKLNSKVDLPVAIERVRQGVTDELNYLAKVKANSPDTYTGTAVDLMVGDPWIKANSLPSSNEEISAGPNQIVIEHPIPTIIPIGLNYFSQTIGGLSSFAVSRPSRPNIPIFNKKGKQIGSRPQAPLVSYSYSTKGTLANDPSGAPWITNGAASYDFETGNGSGFAHLSDGSNYSYTVVTSSKVAYYLEQDVRTDAGGKIIDSDVVFTNKLGGTEISAYVEFNPTTVENAYIQYTDLKSQSAVDAEYDGDGKLIAVIQTSTAGVKNVYRVSPADADYKTQAQQLGKTFNVPVIDPYVAAIKSGLSPKGTLSAQDVMGNVRLASMVAQTVATARPDPGFDTQNALSNGSTVHWSFNVDGTAASREVIDTDQNAIAEVLDASGNVTGIDRTVVGADGVSTLTTHRDLAGNISGWTNVDRSNQDTAYAIMVNGDEIDCPNGVVVSTEYEALANGGSRATGFTITWSLQNSDDAFVTTERHYSVTTDQAGNQTVALTGWTVTTTASDSAVSGSTDYDAQGAVIQSRTLTVDADGNPTISRYDSNGMLLGSSALVIDDTGQSVISIYDGASNLVQKDTVGTDGTLAVSAANSSTSIKYAGDPTGGLTKATYANGGQLASQSYFGSDGTIGQVTTAGDGSSSGTFQQPNGGQSVVVLSATGAADIQTFDANGGELGAIAVRPTGDGFEATFVDSATEVGLSLHVDAEGVASIDGRATDGSTYGVSVDLDGTVSRHTIDPTSKEVETFLNADGSVAGSATSLSNSDGSTVTTQYDEDGNEVGYSTAATTDGITTAVRYSMIDGVEAEVGTDVTKIEEGATTTIHYSYSAGDLAEIGMDLQQVLSDGEVDTQYFTNVDGSETLVGSSRVFVDSQGDLTSESFDAQGKLQGGQVTRFDDRGSATITTFDASAQQTAVAKVATDGAVTVANADTSTTWKTDGTLVQTLSDGAGNVDVISYGTDGKSTTDNWKDADGSTGTTTYNADGTQTTKILFADGTTGIDLIDASGNERTLTYAGAMLISDVLENADGSGHDETLNPDGSDVLNTTAVDGTYTSATSDGKGNSSFEVTSPDGVRSSDGWTHSDSSRFTETYGSDGVTVTSSSTRTTDGSTTTVANDGAGNISTSTTNSLGIVVSGLWTKADGSHGTETSNDGVLTDTSYALDGSYRVETKDLAGNTSWTSYDAAGQRIGSAFSNSDGSYGDTTYEFDGSIVARVHNRDGSYNQVTTLPSGDSTTEYHAADGTLLSTVATADGVSTVTITGVVDPATDFVKHGVFARATNEGEGVDIAICSADGKQLLDINTYTPDLNAGYGGPPDYEAWAVNQSSQLATGEWIGQIAYSSLQFNSPTVGTRPAVPLVQAEEGSPGPVTPGPRHLVWTNATSTAQDVTPQTLQIYPLSGGKSGIGPKGGQPVFIYDGDQLITDGAAPIGVEYVNGLGDALSQVAKLLGKQTIKNVYDDGSWETYDLVNGVIVNEQSGGGPNGGGSTYSAYSGSSTQYGSLSNGETWNSVDAGYFGPNYYIARNADGSIAEWDRGDQSHLQNQYDILHDKYGNTISTLNSGSISQTVTVDKLGDVITSNYAALGEYGSQAVSSSWTESDGTKVSAQLDLTTGAGTETMSYTDGGETVVENDALGNSFGTDYSGSAIVGHEWSQADGSFGSDYTKGDGTVVKSWTNADGSSGTSTTSPTGDETGTVKNADGSLQSTFSTTHFADGSIETHASEYRTDGTVSITDTVTQADGTYRETVQTGDGTSEVITFDGTKRTDKVTQLDGSYLSIWTSSDGNSGTDSMDSTGTVFTSSWMNADGSSGSDTRNTATGEASGRRTNVDGSSSTYDNLTLANGALQEKSTSTDASGNTDSYDTTTQSDGSFVEKVTLGDGSFKNETFDAVSGEDSGGMREPGSNYTKAWDTKVLTNGAKDYSQTLTYDDGSSRSVDTVTQTDGSFVSTWSSSDGSSGVDTSNATGTVVGHSWTHADGTSGTDNNNYATGEASGTRTYPSGESSTYDNLPWGDGGLEEKETDTSPAGLTASYDTITKSDGSFVRSVTLDDGSSRTETFDAATHEDSGSQRMPGDNYTRAWDDKPAADGSDDLTQTLTFDDGTVYTTDKVAQVDGATVSAWTNNNGTHGVDSVGVQSGSGATFAFATGAGTSTLQTFDGNDKLAIGAGVANDQLWFVQNGNDLDISILGTNDTLAIKGWYSDLSQQVQEIDLAGGQALYRSDVQKLVDAMAAFAPPNASQTEYTPDERNALTPVLAANWH